MAEWTCPSVRNLADDRILSTDPIQDAALVLLLMTVALSVILPATEHLLALQPTVTYVSVLTQKMHRTGCQRRPGGSAGTTTSYYASLAS